MHFNVIISLKFKYPVITNSWIEMNNREIQFGFEFEFAKLYLLTESLHN